MRYLPIIFALFALLFAGAPLHAADADAEANRLFVEAVQLVRKADNTYDTKESVRLLRGANNLLKKIVNNYAQSAIAVQLSTHQLIGDFDVSEFEARIRALSCERGGNVEEFLSEYGIASATGPQTEACFLYRMENLLIPPDLPVVVARADWLAVAVDYHLIGQPERARSIILPHMAVLRKNGNSEVQDSYPILARALALTGAMDQAQQVEERIGDCSNRLSTMLTELRITLQQRSEADSAKAMTEAIRDYAEANQCDWQKGITVQALSLTGNSADAVALYEKLLAASGSDERGQGTPPELAVAASMVADAESAVALGKPLAEKESAAVQSMVRNLALRGEYDAAHSLALEFKDAPRKAVALSHIIVVAAQNKGDDKKTTGWMEELLNQRAGAAQVSDQVTVLAAVARAEKARSKDDRWRATFQAAVTAAERAEETQRGPLVTILGAALAQIKTGKPVLD